jgi:uncharacterized membrane protein
MDTTTIIVTLAIVIPIIGGTKYAHDMIPINYKGDNKIGDFLAGCFGTLLAMVGIAVVGLLIWAALK